MLSKGCQYWLGTDECSLEDGGEIGGNTRTMGKEHGNHKKEKTPSLQHGMEGEREGGREAGREAGRERESLVHESP